MVFCRICGRKAENGRECNRCVYFLERGADEFVIRRMLSDDKTKGIWNENEKPLTEGQLSWADVIVVMEDIQRKEVVKRFPKQYLL